MMDFIDQLRVLSAQVERQTAYIQTEEATKHSLVLPFISALGYNIFDPTEVVPEFIADIGIKKGEKVDYAIFKDGKPILLFECKCHTCNLDNEQASQLYRYFTTTSAKFGVLTNGIHYRFFTDIEEPNKMDPKPFFEFSILDVRETLVEILKRFTKAAFNTEENFSTALELKYTKEIKRILGEEVITPSDAFTRHFASQVYTGRITQSVLLQFTEITKRAVSQFINDRINDRLKSAMESEEGESADEKTPAQAVDTAPTQESKIVTTEEEHEAFFVVKAILRDCIDPKRITVRDTQSYCGILLDDNNRKPICRFRFGSTAKQLCLMNADKSEERVPIADLNDIFAYADRLKEIVACYESNMPITPRENAVPSS